MAIAKVSCMEGLDAIFERLESLQTVDGCGGVVEGSWRGRGGVVDTYNLSRALGTHTFGP